MIIMPKRKIINVPVTKIIKETHDTKTIRLGLKEEFEFLPGQFIMFEIDLPKEWCIESAKNLKEIDTPIKEGGLVKKAFSIASSPLEKNYIDVTVKKEIFVSRYLVDELNDGIEVKIDGPHGKFYYHEDLGKDLVLLGGGSGIVPLMCIIRYIKDKGLDVNATLIYSSKTPDDIIYRKELEEIAKEGKIKIINTITRPDGYEWNGETGRIDKEKLDKVSNLANSLVYLCGPTSMVENTISILKNEFKIASERIKKEVW